LIIGTRGSELALWQAHYTQQRLSEIGVLSELKIIKTKGDQIQHLSFDKIEGKGFFTKEIEDALMNGEIDIAVHSHKDLETQEHPHLMVAAVSEREDPRDLLILNKALMNPSLPLHLSDNIRIGTSSVRRKTQLEAVQPNTQFVDIRGNVPTRIQKLRDGQCDGILLAAAGICRLNIDLSEFYAQWLDPSSFIPAPAQGVLAWQCRKDDDVTQQTLQKMHRADIAQVIQIERTILKKMNGGCQLPLGVYCVWENEKFKADVAFSTGLGKPLLQFQFTHPDASIVIEHCLQKIQKWQMFSSAEA
jgi:hydroxymethylbilane synthase